MFKPTIEKIKEVEKTLEGRIEKANLEKNDKIRTFRETCEKEWDKIEAEISGLREDILKRCVDEAGDTVESLKKDSADNVLALKRLTSKKNKIVQSILDKILKEI
ncbi:MAG: hypothetical protein JXJ19_08290 [Elusimicrobia bacterium]|nr:hypothetical protein [Elusimicrobiota bacterium]